MCDEMYFRTELRNQIARGNNEKRATGGKIDPYEKDNAHILLFSSPGSSEKYKGTKIS